MLHLRFTDSTKPDSSKPINPADTEPPTPNPNLPYFGPTVTSIPSINKVPYSHHVRMRSERFLGDGVERGRDEGAGDGMTTGWRHDGGSGGHSADSRLLEGVDLFKYLLFFKLQLEKR